MQVKFLGSGSAFNPTMENSNAYFVAGSRLYLLDCGETAFGRLWNLPAYTEASEVVVLITHLHADHVGSLGSLISYSYYVTKKKVIVVHPIETLVHLLDLMGIARGCYEFRKVSPEATMALPDAVSALPLPVEHVPDMSCFGYVVSDGVERVYFSGDARSVPSQVLEGLVEGSIARMYQDTSARVSDHPTHLSLAQLEEMIPPERRKAVYCIHLDYDYRDLLTSKGFSVVSVE